MDFFQNKNHKCSTPTLRNRANTNIKVSQKIYWEAPRQQHLNFWKEWEKKLLSSLIKTLINQKLVFLQNYRLAKVGWDLWRISGSTSAQAKGTQYHLQKAFEGLQGGDPIASLGSLSQGSVTHTAQRCCLVSWWNLLGFSLCPLTPVMFISQFSLVFYFPK